MSSLKNLARWQDTETSELENSSEHIETVAVPLSPIVELDETSSTDSELLENQCEPSDMMRLDKTDELSWGLTNLDPKRDGMSGSERGDCEDRQLPETPPKVLRKKLNSYQNYSKYLETEYDELFEFTQLEKQIEHEDCVSKETEKLLKDELETLKNKVKYLIQDNEDLQHTNVSREVQITELRSSLSLYQEVQLLTKESINNIGVKLKSLLMGGIEDVLENNPPHQPLSVDNLDNKNDDFSVEDVQSSIDLFLKYHDKLKTKTEELCVENEELKNKSEVYTYKIKDLEKCLITLEHEKTTLENNLLTEVSKNTDVSNALNMEHKKCKEAEALLRTSCLKNSKLEKELHNVFKVNDIQVEFLSVIKELDSLVNYWDTKNDLSDFVDTLLVNKQLISCVNIVMDQDSQTNLVNLLNKIKEKLKLYDKERSVLNKTVQELNNRIPFLENEISDLNSSVIELNCVVQDIINIQIKELEVKLDVVTNEKQNLESKIIEKNNEIIYLTDALHNVKSQLEEKNKLVNADNLDNCKSEDDNRSNHNNIFHLTSETTDNNNYFKEKVEELAKLKEMMANEITCLDSGENKCSILSLSSNELFARLMQNIIKKEEEISESLQKKLTVDLQRAQEKAESSRNKRKSQESWISLLQSDNEAMSKELTCMKDKITSLEIELKNCSINLNCSNAEVSTLKSKLLELSTDNDMLVLNNDKLLNLLKDEKQSVSCLQQSLSKMKEEFTSKEYFVDGFKSNMNIIESTEKQYFNLNKESFGNKHLFVDNKHEDLTNSQSSIRIHCTNEQQTSACDNFIFCDEKCKQIDVLSKSHWVNNAFGKSLENEKVLLVDLLDHSETNEHLGEHLMSCSDNFIIIKDILHSFANKVIEIEGKKSKKLLLMETEFSSVRELCNDIQSDITKLYNDVSDNVARETDISYSQFSQNISCYPYNIMSVKEELEFVKKECIQISSHTRKMRKSAENGKHVIEMLRKEIGKIKQSSLEKDVVIADLRNAVCVGQSEVKELEKEMKKCLSSIYNMAEEKSCLENKIKNVTDQISRLCSTISECDTNVPIAQRNTSNLIECLRLELEQSIKYKCLITDLMETVQFFTSQSSLLICYVKKLENKHLEAQKKNASLAKEVDILKDHMISTKNNVDEADTFLNRLITNIPFKVSSIHQAMEAAEQIFSEHKALKEKERVICDEQRSNLENLAHQQREIISLGKCNSDLKVQLGSYENEIRILRTELRNLRSQWRRNERERLMKRAITNEQDCQTENLCCRELQGQVLKLEKFSAADTLKITSLELQMMEENLQYKKKVSELECALLQAKERIRDLRFELTENKNMAREIVESYNERYQKIQQKD